MIQPKLYGTWKNIVIAKTNIVHIKIKYLKYDVQLFNTCIILW